MANVVAQTPEVTPITEAQLEALRAEHGELHELALKGGRVVVVVRSPSRGEYKRWKEQIRREQSRGVAIENLVRACVVHPGKDALELLVDKYPALYDAIGGELLEIAGVDTGIEKKAL